jgi:hypothetical protein
MTQSDTASPENMREPKLPRRDFIILPLLSIVTIAVCLLASEELSKHYFVTGPENECEVNDKILGYRYRPNCTTRQKAPDGPWVTNTYNECGYRTKESCGQKPPGTTRVSLLGSSMGEGCAVAFEKTFAARTANDLTRILGRPVEIQNLSRNACSILCMFHLTDEALALKPDLLIMVIDPWELEQLSSEGVANRYQPLPPVQHILGEIHASPAVRLKRMIGNNKTTLAVEYFLFQDTSVYARMFLSRGDRSDYLRKPFSPAWEERFEGFDIILGEMARKANAAHVPFVLVELPSFAQASFLKIQNPPAGVDPYALNERLRQIASRHGVQFMDTLDIFKREPKINEFFYVVDTHMNGEGHGLVSQALVEQLIDKQNSALMGNHELAVRTGASPF